MDLLPHSNGVRRVNMRRQKTTNEIIKDVIKILVAIIVIGFVIQQITNFIAGERLIEKVDYTTVDNKRMDYKLDGSGDYTVVFDGVIGGNLEVWSSIVEELQENDSVATFQYNRRGYGFSDSGSKRTIEEQAQDLKILLRKSGASEPYILVGEEYGSLVLTSFAEQFPDSVAGIVLVDTIVDQNNTSTKNSIKNVVLRFRRKIEQLGSYVGLTMILDKLNLDVNMDCIEENLSGDELDEFLSHRTKSSYTTAVSNELSNLSNYDGSIVKEGIFSGKPYYLITKNEDSSLKALGDENLTKTVTCDTDSSVISLSNSNCILTGIRAVIKQCNELAK